MLKKFIFALANCAAVFLLAGCLSAATTAAEKGFVTGTVTDSAGNPLRGVKIIIDHSIFYNSNITTTTDASGKYRVKVPTGSWYAFAQLKKTYNGRNYSFFLEPDNYAGFGGEGAIRNFTWALTGARREPLAPGFFGGLITIDRAVGTTVIEPKEIEFTLKPSGRLIDDTDGETLTLSPSDMYKIEDVPIGRYSVSATYRGRALWLRRWNSDDEFVKTLPIEFEPQIPANCDNCYKLEYKY